MAACIVFPGCLSVNLEVHCECGKVHSKLLSVGPDDFLRVNTLVQLALGPRRQKCEIDSLSLYRPRPPVGSSHPDFSYHTVLTGTL